MLNEPGLPSKIEFASFLVYNPNPKRFPSDASHRSRRVRDAVKKDTAQWSDAQHLGTRVHQEIGDEIRDRFLPAHATLIPMPGHAPMRDELSHWPSREICRAFVEASLGQRWLPLLRRTKAVRKAATSRPEERPTARIHYETLNASLDLTVGSVITVIDDIVTRGASLLAAVARIREALPDATVRGFALIRTISDVPITRIKNPCMGTISLTERGTHREP